LLKLSCKGTPFFLSCKITLNFQTAERSLKRYGYTAEINGKREKDFDIFCDLNNYHYFCTVFLYYDNSAKMFYIG